MSDHLRRRAISGIKWGGFSMVVVTLLHFVTLAILARKLAPADFGLLGMIVIVIGFAQTFADMGLSNALIHRQDAEEKHLSSLFWMNILAGFCIFFLLISLRTVIAGFFKQSVLTTYLSYAAPLFLIIPFGQIFKTLLQKELRFETLSKIEIGGMAGFSLVAISMAFANYGVLSLIFAQLIRSVIEVFCLIAIYKKKWLPKFYLNIKEVMNYLGFGAFQMGERMVNYFVANMDYIIIGRILGPVALGFYTLAYQLMIAPISKINPVITRVAFPVFAKIQHDNPSLRGGYCKAVNIITMISFPLLLGLFSLAPELIRLIFGSKWGSSVVVLEIFCFVGLFKSLGNPVGAVLLAKGRADLGFYLNVITVVVITVAMLIGIQWGIVGVAVSILMMQIPLFVFIQPRVNRLMDLKFKQYFEAIRVPLLSSVVMVGAILVFKMIFAELDLVLLFVFAILTGVFTYLVTYYLNDKDIFKELRAFMRSV